MSSDWWQYQAKKFLPKKTPAPRIPPYVPRSILDDTPPRMEPKPEPMIVEESTASDTAIQRIIRFWTK